MAQLIQTSLRRNPVHASTARSLPLAEWPDAERSAWNSARRVGRRFAPGGPASRFCQETCDDLERRYGQFLNYCRRTGRLEGSTEPGALVEPTAIAGFVVELQARVRSVTVARTIYKVCRTARLIAPARDFSWLAEIAKDLELVAEPMNKSGRLVTSERLVEAGLTLVQEAKLATSSSLRTRSVMARNGLMIAILALCPIRLKNFAGLEIGQSFVALDDSWWIALRKTKSGRPDERPIPNYINPAIQEYLEIYRPFLIGTHEGQGVVADAQSENAKRNESLWVGCLGKPLSEVQIWRSVRDTTRATLGVEICPHLVRASAATTAALHAGDMPNLASALLHHTDRTVTDEHYNRAHSLSVALQYARIIRSL